MSSNEAKKAVSHLQTDTTKKREKEKKKRKKK